MTPDDAHRRRRRHHPLRRAASIRDTHDYGRLSFSDVIVKSSNVGAIKVGLQLGAERMSDYVRRFGFGRRASPDFRGENTGIVWNAVQADRQRAGVGVDGLPGRRHAAADGDRGRARSPTAASCSQPRVVRAVIRDGQRACRCRARWSAAPITPAVAAELTAIMEGVVDRRHRHDGPDRRLHHRRQDRHRGEGGQRPLLATDYNVSFVGFVPSRAPMFTIVVVIDSPHGERLLRRPGVGPDLPAHRRGRAAPRRRAADAERRAAAAGRATRTSRRRARPRRPPTRRRSSRWPPATRRRRRLPRPARPERPRRPARAGPPRAVAARMHGTGLVIEQQPAAGTPLDDGATATFWLHRGAARPAGRATRRHDRPRAAARVGAPAARACSGGAAGRAPRSTGVHRRDPRLAPGASRRRLRRAARPAGGRGRTSSRRRSPPAPRRSSPETTAGGRRRGAVGRRPRRTARSGAARRPSSSANPSREMQVVGITGTNGKTTTSYLLQRHLRGGRHPLRPDGHGDVPDRRSRARGDAHDARSSGGAGLLRQMATAGCGACVMEVSSHALALHRVDGVRFAAAVFTNLTRDHLDFHGDMEHYFAAKRRLFEMLPPGAPALINADDPRAAALVETADRPVTYGINKAGRRVAGAAVVHARRPRVRHPRARRASSACARRWSASRTSTTSWRPSARRRRSACRSPAIEAGARAAARRARPLRGGLDAGDDITVVVDYAHTDDALRNLLETAGRWRRGG